MIKGQILLIQIFFKTSLLPWYIKPAVWGSLVNNTHLSVDMGTIQMLHPSFQYLTTFCVLKATL